MKKLLKAIVLLLGLTCFSQMQASHIMGADLTYRIIDTNNGTYKFTLTLYRDCSGIPWNLAPTRDQLEIRKPGFSSYIVMNLIVQDSDVTPICRPPDVIASPSTNCPGKTPIGTNGIKGVTKTVYEGIYTLGKNLGYVYVGWGMSRNPAGCCRNTSITTGPANQNFWIQAIINTDFVNNSVIFTTPPIPYWCRLVRNTYNHGSLDVYDPLYITINNKKVLRDSLAYQLYIPFSGEAANYSLAVNLQNPTVTLNSPLTYMNFLYTSGLGPVSLDSKTGSISCIPSIIQDAVMAIAVHEFRAIPNSTGGYSRQHVGYVCRDLQFTVRDLCESISILGVIADSLKGAEYVSPTVVDICGAKHAQVSFKIVGAPTQYLKTKVHVMPNPSAIKNFVYKESIVRISSTDTLIGTITFDSAIGVGQEKFTIEAFYCTTIGTRISQYYTLLINFRPSVFVTKQTLYYCTGGRPVRAVVNGGGTSYSWTPTANIVAAATDSSWIDVTPPVTRTYIATAKSVANSTTYCSLVDSVRVINIPKFNYSLSPKTLDLCLQDTFQVSIAAQAADAPYTFTWQDPTNGSLFDTATKWRTTTAQNPKGVVTGSGNYIVDIESKYGCILTDTVKVTMKGVVAEAKGLSARALVCPGDTTMLSVTINPKRCGLTLYTPNANNTVDITHAAGVPKDYPTACNSATPATCYPSPYSAVGLGRSGITRIIYTKVELAALGMKAGIIRSISFNISTLNVNTIDNYEIRMGCVGSTVSDARITVPTFTVYGPQSQTCTGGWNEYTLTRGFDWDGNSNIYIELRSKSTGSMTSANVVRTLNTTPGNTVAYKFSSTAGVSAEDETGGFTGGGLSQCKPHIKFKVSSVDSTGPASILTTVWSPAAQVVTAGLTSPRAIASVTQKDSFFIATVGTAQCSDTAGVKIKVDTNFSVKAAGGKVLCKSGSTNPTVNLTTTIKGTPDSIRWYSIPATAQAGMPANRTTANLTVTPDIGTWKYVVVTYDLPCSAVDTVTVTVNSNLTVNFSIDSPVCSALNGKLTAILPPGGTTSMFNFSWKKTAVTMGGRTSDTLNNIGPADYTLDIVLKTDATCVGTITRNVAPVIIKLNPVISTAGILCNGGTANLTINASATRSPGPYAYSWSLSPSWTSIGATQTITNKTASPPSNPYRVIVIDNITSCRDTGTYDLKEPSALTVGVVPEHVKCKGDATGRLTATAAGGTIGGGSYIYSWTKTASAFTSGLNDLLNITAGTYNLTVTDLNGCTVANSTAVNEPVKALTIDSLVARNAKFVNGNDGNAVAYMSGGTANYNYRWNKGALNLITNTNKGVVDSIRPSYGGGVNKGMYNLTVTDNNGCTVSGNVFVNDIICRWYLNYTIDTVLCFGFNTGAIHISAIDSFNNNASTTLYTYKLYQYPNADDTTMPAFTPLVTKTSATPWTTVDFPNLYSDEVKKLFYTLRIQTNLGCDTLIPFVAIKQNPKLKVNDSVTIMPSCFGKSDGEIHIKSLLGGLFPPFRYNYGAGFITDSFTKDRAAGGPYTMYVTDNHACFDTLLYKIDTPPRIATLGVITDTVRCFGEDSGKGRILIVNPDLAKVGNFAFIAKPGTNTDTSSDMIMNVPRGTYNLTVTFENLANKKRCPEPATLVMVEPPVLTLTNTPSNLRCSNTVDGSILPIPSGGNSNPMYKATLTMGAFTRIKSPIDSPLTSAGTPKDSFAGLDEGVYTLVVEDRRGCKATNTPITLTKPAEFKIGLSKVNASCIESPNGSVKVDTIYGGNPTPPSNYIFQWSRKDELSGAVTGLSNNGSAIAGQYGLSTYTVTATDSKGCTDVRSIFVDTNYVLRINQIATTVAPCYGGNGTMTITSMSPAQQPSYNYTFSNGSTGFGLNTITAPKGTYTMTVTDANNCVTTGVSSIDERPDIIITGKVYDSKCYNDATGSVKINVGGGTPPFKSIDMRWNSTPNQLTDSATQLKAGNYTVRVKDANACEKEQTFTVEQPEELIATIDSKRDITCYAANNGEIHVKTTGGVPTLRYVWNQIPDKTADVINLKPSPASNPYRVTVTDANGCSATASTSIEEPKKLEFVEIKPQAVSCPHYSDGLINIVATGGTITNAKQYEYSIDGGISYVSGSKFTTLPAGDYNVIVKDNNGCVAARKVTVSSPEELYITAMDSKGKTIITDTIKMGDQVILDYKSETQSGVIPVITNIDWMPQTGLTCNNCQKPKASPYESTDYLVEVRYGMSCVAKSKIRVPVHDPLDFFVPSAFTPGNADGINDILYVYGNGIKKIRFMVFNRWGEKMFESDHLSKGWDGIFKGELQEVGVYSYVAEVEYLNGDKKNKKGSVTLIR